MIHTDRPYRSKQTHNIGQNKHNIGQNKHNIGQNKHNIGQNNTIQVKKKHNLGQKQTKYSLKTNMNICK